MLLVPNSNKHALQSRRDADRTKAERRKMAKLHLKLSYPTDAAYGAVYLYNGKPRFKVMKGTGQPGLIKWFINEIQAHGAKSLLSTEKIKLWKPYLDCLQEILVPVIDLRNELVTSDGKKRHLTEQVIIPTYEEGYVPFEAKRLFDRRLMDLFRITFPKAMDGLAYIRGLGTPCIGNGIFTGISMVFKDIMSKNADGQIIHAGCDGSGRIHPEHFIFKQYGVVCALQIRIWNPFVGDFVKGILVPDFRCVDSEGRPTVWVDWMQHKGAWKKKAMDACGKWREDRPDGPFDKDGVLVNPKALIEVEHDGGGFIFGILRKVDESRPGKWCYQQLENIKQTDRTEDLIIDALCASYTKLEKDGGLYGILDTKAEEYKNIEFTKKLCEKLTSKIKILLKDKKFKKTLEKMGIGPDTVIDPMALPSIWNVVQEGLKHKRYHMRQGAGIHGLQYMTVIDNGIPPGSVVINKRVVDGVDRFNHGDELAVTRLPIMRGGSLWTGTVVSPKEKGFEHLSHLLINGEVLDNVIYMNAVDLVLWLIGDDDGDFAIVNPEEWAVEMYKAKVWDGDNHIFLIEPDKDATSDKSKIPLCEEDGSCSLESLKAYGDDPDIILGLACRYRSYFKAPCFHWHAEACTVLGQEAVDSKKHIVFWSDPRKLSNPKNWKVNSDGHKYPANCKAKIGGEFVFTDGTFNVKAFIQWASEVTGGGKKDKRGKKVKGPKLREILTWVTKSKEHCVTESDVMPFPHHGQNLVHFSAIREEEFWYCFKERNIKSRDQMIDLAGILPLVLGKVVKPMHPKGSTYRKLMDKSGLPAWGAATHALLNNAALDSDQLEYQMHKETLLLTQELRQLSIDEQLLIWVTELTTSEKDTKNWKGYVNRAFRAITFDGSPVLEELDIEMDTPCWYLDGEEKVGDEVETRLNICFDELKKIAEEGEEEDIFHAAVNWWKYAGDHEEKTRTVDEEGKEVPGVPAEKCRYCSDLFLAKAVSVGRKVGSTVEQTKFIGATFERINSRLQGRTSRRQ